MLDMIGHQLFPVGAPAADTLGHHPGNIPLAEQLLIVLMNRYYGAPFQNVIIQLLCGALDLPCPR
jgi:hypothetical protein